jgi:transmembrane sensor
MNHDMNKNTIQKRASYWVTRLHSSDCTDTERYAFDDWLAASEQHRIAYQQVSVCVLAGFSTD